MHVPDSRLNNSNKSEVLFNSPGCDPFHVPTSPKSYYFPSNMLKPPSKLKTAILTPEKLEKFPAKTCCSYIPLNYSFSENDLDNNEHLLSSTSNQSFQITPSLSGRLVNADPIFCNSKKSLEDHFESVDEDLSSNSDCAKLKKAEEYLAVHSQVSSISNLAGEKSKKLDESLDVNLKTLSLQESNVSELVKRFRYGKPLHRSQRKTLLSSLKPPSVGGKAQSKTLESNTVYSPDSSLVLVTTDEQPASDADLKDLQLKVEKLLKDSTTTLTSSPLSNLVLNDANYFSNGVEMTKEVSVIKNTNQPKAAVASSDHSISNDSNPSNDFDHTVTKSTASPSTEPTITSSCFRKCAFGSPCAPSNQKDFLAKGDNFLVLPPTPHVDILQQWRLRRKMEAARSAAHQPENLSVFPDFNPNKQFDTAPSSSFRNPPKLTRSIGVSAIPMTTVETQTSPKPSNTSRENSTPSCLESSVELHDDVSEHKVTIVPCNDTSCNTFVSMSDKTRSEVSAGSKKLIKEKPKFPFRQTSDHLSPTTTMVKKVIGARLFDQSNSSHKSTSEDTLGSLGESMPSGNTLEKEQSTELISEVLDLEETLEVLRKNIDDDAQDFLFDPVLILLREQRREVLKRLQSVEEELECFQRQENQGN